MAKGKSATPSSIKPLEPIKHAPISKPVLEEKKKVEESDEYSLEFDESKAIQSNPRLDTHKQTLKKKSTETDSEIQDAYEEMEDFDI